MRQPNYMRAWTNMGVAYANVGDYARSAAFYARALALNPGADHVWGYLRTSLACAGQPDMLAAADRRDLAALQAGLPL
jgi:peroxin-5